ncbi:MAG: glycosyltransferase family 2 protein, partial [Candidatus Aenigmatarchaeota archaeon]
MDKRKPFISIIIPTLNEEGYIENCLKSIKRQSYKNYEI